MTGPCCTDCRDRSESHKSFHRESAPSGTGKEKAPEGSDIAEQRGEVETRQESYERVCCRELHLTLCN